MYAFDRPMALPICRVSSLRGVSTKISIYRYINKRINIIIYIFFFLMIYIFVWLLWCQSAVACDWLMCEICVWLLANDCTASVVKRGCLFPAQNSLLFINFCQNALLVFLLCVRIEHTSYTNTLFRYLSNIVLFSHYIIFIHCNY